MVVVVAGRQWENDRVDYRKWTIRLGASLGTALLVAAMYAAMITRSWCNGSGVCDAPAPDHFHSRLAVVLGTVIVHAVATDPAEAVRSKADERSVAIPGIAGTLVEISDSHGNLVSINALCNLGQAGTGWTAPKYRALVPNQMGGALQPSS